MTAPRSTGRSTGAPGAETAFSATGIEVPVFLDPSGRRRRWVALGGATLAALTAAWLTCLVLGAIGFSSLPAVHAPQLFHAARRRVHPVFVASRGHQRALHPAAVRH